VEEISERKREVIEEKVVLISSGCGIIEKEIDEG
jgi:hypothetical protein